MSFGGGATLKYAYNNFFAFKFKAFEKQTPVPYIK